MYEILEANYSREAFLREAFSKEAFPKEAFSKEAFYKGGLFWVTPPVCRRVSSISFVVTSWNDKMSTVTKW